MYTRISIVFLAAVLNFTASADEGKPTLLLKPLQFQCDIPENLEILLDQKVKRPNDGLLELLYGSNVFCMPTSNYQRIFRVRDVQGSRHKYVCYRLWDITNPYPPGEKEHEFCSGPGSVTTTQELAKERSGDFSIEQHEKYDQTEVAVASCRERGRVSVRKRNDGWERSSNLPIYSPTIGLGEPVFVNGTLDEVLRDGCKAKDYP
jgi:hypothetical protein